MTDPKPIPIAGTRIDWARALVALIRDGDPRTKPIQTAIVRGLIADGDQDQVDALIQETRDDG